jgi:dTDP-4-dehydrorhamnose reductase
MSEKILIFGNGQIGNFYYNFFKKKNIESKLSKCDITKADEISKEVQQFNPTVVINTAAKTNLEWCENNKLEAFNVNVLGANNIAEICDKNEIYFIHFSSGCIFESKHENDKKDEYSNPEPAAYYSLTKVWAEQLIQFNKSKSFKYLILRPRQPISAEINYKNMLIKFLTFTKFVDTPNTGTVIEDLMEWTLELLETKPVGVLNIANEGFTTPYKIAKLLKKYVLPELPIEKISKKELDKLTPNRRVDTILDVTKLKNLVNEVKSYEQRMEEVIKKLAQNFATADIDHIKTQLDLTVKQSKQRTVVNNVWKNLLKRKS